MSMMCCVISHIVLFYKGMFKCLKEILTRKKMKLELECKFFCYNIQKVLCCNLVLDMKLEDVLEVPPMLMP